MLLLEEGKKGERESGRENETVGGGDGGGGSAGGGGGGRCQETFTCP